MLNPRCFLEDCYRLGKLDFFATPFPWAAIDNCIDPETFNFNAPTKAREAWLNTLALDWDNIDDSSDRIIMCPNCDATNQAEWTLGNHWNRESRQMIPGTGLADCNFGKLCHKCSFLITHDSLRAQKFRSDVQRLLGKGLPMPGTVLAPQGQPGEQIHFRRNSYGKPMSLAPNRRLQDIIGTVIIRSKDFGMAEIKETIEQAVKGVSDTAGKKKGSRDYIKRFSYRRMLARYWENSSPFALDLVGAVVRQGVFVEKMHELDWLHSPALRFTMKRLITKYERFFTIMAQPRDPPRMAVPTLDVDLAWHTHQLHAQAYYIYSDVMAPGRLIDHDDKVAEADLDDAFKWTSKTYQSKYGEPYSECTCWYCEAVRESQTGTMDRIFRGPQASANGKLHVMADGQGEADRDHTKLAPHISAHNAIRTAESDVRLNVIACELPRSYQKVCDRARKRGQKAPDRKEFLVYYYGCPVMWPVYYPYAASYSIAGGTGVYYADPCWATTAESAYGFCIAGTCGALVAAGGAGTGGNGQFSPTGCGSGAGGGACVGSGGCSGGGAGCGSGGGCGGGGGGGCGGGT